MPLTTAGRIASSSTFFHRDDRQSQRWIRFIGALPLASIFGQRITLQACGEEVPAHPAWCRQRSMPRIRGCASLASVLPMRTRGRLGPERFSLWPPSRSPQARRLFPRFRLLLTAAACDRWAEWHRAGVRLRRCRTCALSASASVSTRRDSFGLMIPGTFAAWDYITDPATRPGPEDDFIWRFYSARSAPVDDSPPF